MQFNPNRNRVINGICEYCGVKADSCGHYNDRPKPLDEKERLALSETAPAMPHVAVEPLKDHEKAKSLAEAQAKTKEFLEATQTVQLVEPENTEL